MWGPTGIAAYAYDNLGRRTAVTRGNGVSTSYSYDAVSRLTGLSHDLPGGTTHDVAWTYGYNPAGQVVTQTQSNDLYAFTGRSAGTDAYTNNGLNQVTAVNATGVSYDANGNLTSDGTRTYTYDAANRPVSTNGGASTLSYDPLGRLRNMVGTAGGQYLYEGAALAGVVPNASSTINNRIIQGPWPDEIVVAYQGSSTSDPRWSLQDRLGSVVAITDGGAAVNAVNAYDEYGRPQSGNGGRMQYTGQLWLPDFGVYHYKARQYHAGLGRFLQTDPISYAAGVNLYAYVSGDPVNMTDPFGLVPAIITTCRVSPGGGDEWTGDGEPIRPCTDTRRGGLTVAFPGSLTWGGRSGSNGGGSSVLSDMDSDALRCAGRAVAANAFPLLLDAAGIALLFTPPGAVVASAAGIAIGSAALVYSVINMNPAGVVVSYAGKTASFASGVYPSGGVGAGRAAMIGRTSLAVSIMMDGYATFQSYKECMGDK